MARTPFRVEWLFCLLLFANQSHWAGECQSGWIFSSPIKRIEETIIVGKESELSNSSVDSRRGPITASLLLLDNVGGIVVPCCRKEHCSSLLHGSPFFRGINICVPAFIVLMCGEIYASGFHKWIGQKNNSINSIHCAASKRIPCITTAVKKR